MWRRICKYVLKVSKFCYLASSAGKKDDSEYCKRIFICFSTRLLFVTLMWKVYIPVWVLSSSPPTAPSAPPAEWNDRTTWDPLMEERESLYHKKKQKSKLQSNGKISLESWFYQQRQQLRHRQCWNVLKGPPTDFLYHSYCQLIACVTDPTYRYCLYSKPINRYTIFLCLVDPWCWKPWPACWSWWILIPV